MTKQMTTQQLMEAAIKTVQQMSPEEKAKARQQMDATIQQMRTSLQKKSQPPEVKKRVVICIKKTCGTLAELADQLAESFQKPTPKEQKQFQSECRKHAREQITEKPYRSNRTREGEWIQ